MIDYFGLLLTGIGTIVFVFKDPWDKKILNSILSLGLIGVLFLAIGIIITGMSTYYSNLEKTGYKTQLDTIDITVQKTFSTTNQGFENILKEYEVKTSQLINNFTENYNILTSTIIDQSDSTLNAQLLKIKLDYQKLNDEYLVEKDITQRYYFSEQWPWSSKNEEISNALFYFVPTELGGLITGQDRYIIWYLIERNGHFPFSQIDTLYDEMRTKLKPMSLSIITNLERLELLKVIKPNYWKGNIEFSDYFSKRLEGYKAYYNVNKDMYIKKMIGLEMENR